MTMRGWAAAQCIESFDVWFGEAVLGVASVVVEGSCINTRGTSLAVNSRSAGFALVRDEFPVALWEKGILESIHHGPGRVTDGSSHVLSVESLWAPRGIGCLRQIDRLWVGRHGGDERTMDTWQVLNAAAWDERAASRRVAQKERVVSGAKSSGR